MEMRLLHELAQFKLFPSEFDKCARTESLLDFCLNNLCQVWVETFAKLTCAQDFDVRARGLFELPCTAM
eukprot:4235339-Pyramimonas_sp.AAC.1